MKKLCCYLGYYKKGSSNDNIIIDISNVFRNTPNPYITKEENYFYPFHKELSVGQLFYYTVLLKPGNMHIKVEPVDILEYPSLVRGYQLFSQTSLDGNNRYKNMISEKLVKYYEDTVKNEIRDRKITNIIENEETNS